MFHVQYINSLDDPVLAPYRTMRRPLEHREQGIFVAEGEKVVRRLLESSLEVVSVLLPSKWLPDYEPLLKARPETLPVYLAEKNVLEQLIGFSMYQGLLAVGKLPPAKTLDDVLNTAPGPKLFAAVDGVTSAENLGALIRNCGAFGVHGLLVGDNSTSPYLRRAIRNSMGTIFNLPVVESLPLPTTLHDLRRRSIRCIAAHPHIERTLSQANFGGDCCIVFGSEGTGITPAALNACDDAVAIPMAPGVDSLNVGAAAAVFLYEVSRQRKALNR